MFIILTQICFCVNSAEAIYDVAFFAKIESDFWALIFFSVKRLIISVGWGHKYASGPNLSISWKIFMVSRLMPF